MLNVQDDFIASKHKDNHKTLNYGATEVHKTLAMYPCAKQNQSISELWVLTTDRLAGLQGICKCKLATQVQI